MEWEIGEIRQVGSEWYQCVKSSDCPKCDLKNIEGGCKSFPCEEVRRQDGNEVIFKKLEKVGEIFYCDHKKHQCYKFFKKPATTKDKRVSIQGESCIAFIEIKQNKEDMEEKKQNCDGCKYSDEEMKIIERAEKDVRKAMGGAFGLPKDIPYLHSFVSSALELGWLDKYTEHSNSEKIGKDLRPFDLQKAKAGKPVCTRDGRKARIICFDRNWDMHIVALVADPLGESVHYYLSNGKVGLYKENDLDLMMLSEKKEGWVNIYKGDDERVAIVSNAYATKEKALSKIDEVLGATYITTNKIEWEE